MKKKILEKLKSLNKRLAGDWPRRIGVAHRLRSFYEQMKWSLKNKVNFYLANPFEMERCYRLYLDPFSTNFYR
jgi:hypothetical protein